MSLVMEKAFSGINIKKMATLIPAGALVLGLSIFSLASAESSTVVVTPTDTQGWAQSDTRTGGATNYVADSSAPLGSAALQLTTDSTNAAKADYMHAADLPLSQLNSLGYSTKQVTAGLPEYDASFQLAVDTNGSAPGGFTTLVYEPYWQNNQSPDAAPVVANQWQTWQVSDDSGYFWSTQSVGGMDAGHGGAPFYTLAQVKAMNPDATVLGYGVAIGSYNPSSTINVDAVQFNGTTYNFELTKPKPVTPTTKDECKNGGYMNFQTQYKNQGQCVSSVVSNKSN